MTLFLRSLRFHRDMQHQRCDHVISHGKARDRKERGDRFRSGSEEMRAERKIWLRGAKMRCLMSTSSADNAPVLVSTSLAQRLAILDHNQKRRDTCQTDERCGYEAVLVPHVCHPRCDAAKN